MPTEAKVPGRREGEEDAVKEGNQEQRPALEISQSAYWRKSE